MPSKPACRASARQVSSGVSPPNSGMSSLLHPIGLTPRRTRGSAIGEILRSDRRDCDGKAELVILPERNRRCREMGSAGSCAVVFDLGGVLIDWDPRHLY